MTLNPGIAATQAELEAICTTARAELFANPRPALERQIELRAIIGKATVDLLRLRREIRLRNAGIGQPRFVDLGTEVDAP